MLKQIFIETKKAKNMNKLSNVDCNNSQLEIEMKLNRYKNAHKTSNKVNYAVSRERNIGSNHKESFK